MRPSNRRKDIKTGVSPEILPEKPSLPDVPLSECARCGTCCKKGGPSFHLEDKTLIEKGVILSKFLYTIRKGEMSYDNVKACLLPAPTDIIKIKGQKNSWTCVFLDAKKNDCTIYADRPLECRVLKCWDTQEIEKIYSENRLTRKDLIAEIEGLWDLVEDHQTRCSYQTLKRFADALDKDDKNEAAKGILDLIGYDTRIRELVVKKGGLDPHMVDFLFGRPMTETIRMYGLRIDHTSEGYRLTPIKQNIP